VKRVILATKLDEGMTDGKRVILDLPGRIWCTVVLRLQKETKKNERFASCKLEMATTKHAAGVVRMFRGLMVAGVNREIRRIRERSEICGQ
jgi:hypothetical protein